MKKDILKVLVGSRAQGLEKEDSDWDYRNVYVIPTRELICLGPNQREMESIGRKEQEDISSWEIGRFSFLATKSNPTILEVFVSPVEYMDEKWGKKLIELFPYLLNKQDALNAFVGYSKNQEKKFLNDKDGRPWKYAVAYVRTLMNAISLFRNGTFSMRVEGDNKETLEKIRDVKMSKGEVVDLWQKLVVEVYKTNSEIEEKRTNWGKVNEFLLEIRKENW